MFDHIKAELSDIKVQTSLTNGRVNKLEQWLNYAMGAISMLLALVIPLVVYVYQNSL